MNGSKHDEQAFIDRARDALDDRAEELDYVTAQRLSAVRRRALSAPPRRPWLIPAGAFAAASVMVLTVTLWWTGPVREGALPPVADMALLADDEGVDFYDDLEFYVWLAGTTDVS